jgi:Domain of unknown function (DUF4926)
MKEFDVVKLTRDYPEFGLRAGASGTIVHEHVEIEGLPKTFIVEFNGPDAPYNSIVEDIEAAHLRLVAEPELAELRAKSVAAE